MNLSTRALYLSALLLLATHASALNCIDDGAPLNLTQEQLEELLVVPKQSASVDGQTAETPYIQIDDMRFQVSTDEKQGTSAFTGNRWPDGIVYYEFGSNVSDDNKQRFRNAALEWENAANLTFIESNTATYRIHVKSDPGNWSYVGRQPSYRQPQEMGIYNWSYKYIIVHEIGHALGLAHEHARSDRDTYVNIIRDNIYEDYYNNFEIKYDSVNHGEYDFHSVMHYSPYAFAKVYGTYTIIPKPAYAEFLNIMGQRNYLSYLDKEGMAEQYGPPNKLTFSPASLDFQANLLGTSKELSVIIQNDGDDTRSGTISVSAPFSVTSSDTYSLANGATQHVTVCYQPTAEIPSSTDLSFSSGESINVNGRGVSNNDDDGDGATNYEEEIAGTSKTNPHDVFKVVPVSVSTNNIATFRIATKTSRSYQLQMTHNLVYIPWYNVGDELIGDGSTTNLTAFSNKKNACFRVIVNMND